MLDLSKVILVSPMNLLQSANAVTSPREKITRITSSSPADARSPFYDPSGAPMKPLARIVMTRQRVYEKSCTDTSLLTEEVGHPDNSGDALRRNTITNKSALHIMLSIIGFQ